MAGHGSSTGFRASTRQERLPLLAALTCVSILFATPTAVIAWVPEPEAALSAPPAGYELVWSDEFSEPGLPSEDRWVYDTEANATGWYNNELQYYAVRRLENTRVEDGVLKITARKERLTSADDHGGQDYTSGRLITRGKAAWRYAYVEVRAKLPCGRGTWPAIWMLGASSRRWPDAGEIDIMEQVGAEPEVVSATIHTRATKGTYGIGKKTRIEGACERFHTYHMLWDKDRIEVGVDGESYFTYANDGEGRASWPFDKPQYLLLNLAIGGDMGGEVDDSIFPREFQVDYVRVFQPRDEPRR